MNDPYREKTNKTKGSNPYDSKFLETIENNTATNQHSKNLYLISKKGNLSTTSKAKSIYDRHEKRNYLTAKDRDKRSEVYNKAYSEIENKYGKKVRNDVYSKT